MDSSEWKKIQPNSVSFKNVTNNTQAQKTHSKIIGYLILVCKKNFLASKQTVDLKK